MGKLINVDLDGVGYPFILEVGRYHENKMGRKIDMTPIKGMAFEKWDWRYLTGDRVHPKGLERAWFQGVENHHVSRRGEPIRGFVSALKTLQKRGWEIRIVTKRLLSWMPSQWNLINATSTAEWLKEYEIPFDDLVLTGSSDKQSYPADVIIDDGTHLSWVQDEAFNLHFKGDPLTDYDEETGEYPKGVLGVSSWGEIDKLIGQHVGHPLS